MAHLIYKDLKIHFTSTFLQYWHDIKFPNTQADTGVSLWRPDTPHGINDHFALGDYLGLGAADFNGTQVAPVVADLNGPTGSALRPPEDYEHLWSHPSGCSIWRPVPPPGYASLGCLAGNGLQKPVSRRIRCVREDLVIRSRAGEQVWHDRNSGALTDFSAWSISPPDPIPSELFFSPGTFIGTHAYTRPSPSLKTYSLRTQLTTRSPLSSTVPLLKSHARPPVTHQNKHPHITELPWLAINDPELSPVQQVAQSPIYYLERTDRYVLIEHAYNDTSQTQRLTWTTTYTEQLSTTDTKTESVKLETGVSVTVMGVFNSSLKMENTFLNTQSLTRGQSTSKSSTVSCTLGAHTSVAVYYLSSHYRLLRTNGSQVLGAFTQTNEKSLFWSEYPPGNPGAVDIQVR